MTCWFIRVILNKVINYVSFLLHCFFLFQLFTDRLFLVDGIKAANLQAKVSKSPNYYYFFDYQLDMPVIFKANLTGSSYRENLNTRKIT